MPEGKGYKMSYGSSPAVKQKMGDYGGSPTSTPASQAGASGRSYTSGAFKRNPKQKDAPGGGGRHRNLVSDGDYGNKGY